MKLEISGRNYEVADKLHAYVTEKLNRLEKFVPRSERDAAHAVVVLEDDVSGREDNRYVCEVTMTVPGAQLVAREGTVNMFAAIDIVEAKLQAQLSKHKDKHDEAPHRGKHMEGWTGRTSGDPQPEPNDEAAGKGMASR